MKIHDHKTKTMSSLTLIVHVLDQCKQGVCFPEAENVWPRDDLIQILNLSGIMGPLPDHYTHEKLLQIFLDHLNVQTPKVYALCTEQALILDSSTIQVRHNLLQVGPYAQLQPLESRDCRHLWRVFWQHVNVRRDLRAPESRDVMEKQMQILGLEKEVAKLKKQMKDSETGRLRVEFDEAGQVIKALEAKLREERQQIALLKEKNLTMAREAQTAEARALDLREQLQQVRNKLSVRTLSPEDLERALDDVAALKQQLVACESRG